MNVLDRFCSKQGNWRIVWGVLFFFCIWLPAAHGQTPQGMDACMLQLMQAAADDMTLGELRAKCRQQTEDAAPEAPAVSRKLAANQASAKKPFTFMSHKPNYFLFGAMNFKGYDSQPYQEQYRNDEIEARDAETQFQISFKFPLAIGLFNQPLDLYAAYTNRSFWQLFSTDISSPFRETNHEPEVWLQMPSDWQLAGIRNKLNMVGIVHQSNGQGGVLSRSWNRVYANAIFEIGDLALDIKPWIRLPEEDEKDDNPDITDFLGHCELRAAYAIKGHTLSLMLRNNLESGFKNGAVEFGWSFPFGSYDLIKGYIQYFSGYGESLIDYNRYVNRVGVGFLLYDWL